MKKDKWSEEKYYYNNKKYIKSKEWTREKSEEADDNKELTLKYKEETDKSCLL